MTRFQGQKNLPILFFPFIFVGVASAASPDPKLLSLVPPGAQIVAGIDAPPPPTQPDSFVLKTHINTLDLEDFFALTGADGSRIIHQIVFVAMAINDGQPSEHSLLVSGHFDQPHVFKSAADGGATVAGYRQIPVLEIQPFARERSVFNDVRWLTVLDSKILVFGSIGNVRLELDRYLAHSQIDESLLRRLARLRNKDQTWCLFLPSVRTLSSLAQDQEMHGMLAALNPQLAELAQIADEFEFGTYYGRRVEFEYEVTMASTRVDRSTSGSLLQSPAGPAKNALLPTLDAIGDTNISHGVVEVPLFRYREWLAEIKRSRFPLN